MSPLSIIAAALLVGFGLGGTAAWKVQTWRHDAALAEQLQEAQRMAGQRQAITVDTGAKSAAAQARIRVVTVKQTEEVTRYVPSSDCPMSPGFRVLHDAAAAGELPDAGRIADAAAVPATVVAGTVIANYGACNETAQRLIDLQDFIRKQAAVK